MKKNIQSFSKNSVAIILILAIIFGFLGGSIGGIFIKNYFEKNYYDVPFFGEIDLSQNDIERKLVITNPKKVVVNQNENVNDTINSAASSAVGIFEKKKIIESDNLKIDLNYYYNLNDNVGQGLVVTSDGWIITCFSPEGVSSNSSGLPGYVIITENKEIFEIDNFIKDALTGFSFLHVQAKNFTPKEFTDVNNLRTGELLVAVDWQNRGWLTSYVGQQSNTSLVRYSEDLSDKLVLAEVVPVDFACSFLFDLSGNVAGLINKSGESTPLNYLRGAINSILEYEDIRRATLGINYINIENLASVNQENNNMPKQGAAIYKALNGVAVVKSSSADKAGLKEGDVILSIDDVKINQDNDLVDILQNYFSEDEVIVEFWREGKTDKTTVEL